MKTTQIIPQGRTRNEIQQREKIIKNFYASWNATNPEKRLYNPQQTRNSYSIVRPFGFTRRHTPLSRPKVIFVLQSYNIFLK